MSTQPDNLEVALNAARTYLGVAEYFIKGGDLKSAISYFTDAQAHLDWAKEILATRAKAKRRSGS